MNYRPIISIVTPSLNQGKYILDNLNSIHTQNYDNFEHIIMDACSTDETAAIVNRFPKVTFRSEKDTGPANAINKGFLLAKGDIFAWLNADDYYEENIFERVAEIFVKNKIDLLIGGLTFVDENKKLLFKEKTIKINLKKLINMDSDMRQPCSFFSRKLFEKVGGLDESLKVVFDYDLFVKFLKNTDPSFSDLNIAYYRDHLNTITRTSVRRQAFEIFKVSRSHGAKIFSKINKISLRKFITGKL